MKTYKIYIRLASLIFLLVLLITASYAWYVTMVSINGIVAQTGTLTANTTLYHLNDFNLDGVVDTDSNNLPIETQVSSINILNLNPGEVYTYKIDLTNTGTIDGLVSVSLGSFSGALQDVLYAKVISPTNFNGVYLNGKTSATLCTNLSIPVGQTKSIEFIIKFSTVDELTSASIPYNTSMPDLNYYANKSFGVSKIIINLSQVV